ncbi:MAG TPA: FtsX-like permease family protein [Solirubrobacteraceae bacterium]|jgi:putative ABC transport system permease protein|nr:FtsX-like permease family protein [Solirubrobacteraceae bacterium]
MRPGNLLHLYRVRLRARLLQEFFAVVGIAAGVALLFASQIASQSLSSSVAQLSRGIVGDATLQLLARQSTGFDEHVLAQVRRLPGVRVAAPLLEANANAIGPHGTRSVELVGTDESLKRLGGALVRHTHLVEFGGVGAILLPAPLARSIGVTRFEAMATLEIAGRVSSAPLYDQLYAKQIGPLIDSPVVVAPLFYAQEMAGLEGRVTRILIAPEPGREAAVRAALTRLAAGRLDVESTSYDEQLFAKAATASNQSTDLFAVISALVGFLFAFNAMLLTVPQRRRLVADLRREGYGPGAVVAVMALDAAVLGLLACALGLALGEELSIRLFHANPGYLSSAFAVGSSRVVGAKSVIVALAGGMLAALVAVLSPLRAIVSRDPLAVASERLGGLGTHRTRLLAGIGCAFVALALVVLAAAPQLAVAGMLCLICALLALLPLALDAALGLVRWVAPRLTSAVPHVAVMELRAASSRAVAVAATGAIAVFGSVSIQGAHADLQRGLEDAAHDMNAFTDLWVAPTGGFNLLITQPFDSGAQAKLERLPGVSAVRDYRGGLLDWGSRRIWVIAPPSQADPLIPPSQLVHGDLEQADARVRAGGWAVLSEALANEHHLRIGQAFTLPAPRPKRMRLAAISTNIGWAPGAIIVNADEYAREWQSEQPSAYNVLLARGTSPQQGLSEVRRALGARSGLTVQSAEQHAQRQRTLTREGLARLTQIATLILVVAVLAMAAAMGSMIWQRRPRLAKLKLEGFNRTELWATIVLESLILLVVGCAAGAILGLLGQQLLDRALATIINYPVAHSIALPIALETLALVTIAATLIVAIPGNLATRVPAGLALQE